MISIQLKSGDVYEGQIIRRKFGLISFKDHERGDIMLNDNEIESIDYIDNVYECEECGGAHKTIDCTYKQIILGERMVEESEGWYRI